MLKKEFFGDPFLDCTGSVQFCIYMFLSVEPFKPPSSQHPIAQQIMDAWNERRQRASLQAWQLDGYDLANLPPVTLQAPPKQHFIVDHQWMSYFPPAQQLSACHGARVKK